MNGATVSHTLLVPRKDGPVKPRFGKHGSRWLVIIGVVLLGLALVAGFVPRLSQRKQSRLPDTNQLAIPTVSVMVSPTTACAPPDGLMLPAEVKP